VDGDGRDDLCVRYGVGLRCWISDGVTFARAIEGPAWSDASGFGLARYYGTLRMGDLNGDGMADACIRTGAGLQYALSDDDGFPTLIDGPTMPPWPISPARDLPPT
jgi:hypothetical protein